ncbi:MAG TPA: selenocysteine-specific translation elongation factor [Alphaproteobacteria bacterium]|nr:selenocysteine-specific translation elongation factor [Alphaproteobacteria bacterium]
MIIATAGHVDHGKTSLLKALTGVDADRLPEEKKRGLTIDLGFVYDTAIAPDTVIGFVDVPGHERFIHNMLAGVTAISGAMLVVAADDGPMPQTREHLAILDLVGIETGFVVLTKIDKVDDARVSAAADEIVALLDGTRLAGAPIFPVSATQGTGVDGVAAHLRMLAEAEQRAAPHGNFRLAIDRAFTIAGAGVVVTGLISAGSVRTGDAVILSPEGRELRVRGLRAQDRPVDKAVLGDRCAINLAGRIHKEEIKRGDWIVAERAHGLSRRIDVALKVLGTEERALKHWAPVHIHLGTADVTGRVALLEGKAIEPKGSGLAQLVLDTPVSAKAGDAVIIRDQSARRTLGGGKIVDPLSPRRGRARPERLAWLRALLDPDREAALAAILAAAPGGAPLNSLEAAWNLSAAEAEAMRARVAVCCIGEDGIIGLTQAHHDALAAAVLAGLEDWHRAHPNAGGANGPALMRSLPLRVRPAVFDHIVATLIGSGEISGAGAVLQRRGFAAVLSPADEKDWQRVRAIMDAATARPPTIHEIAEELGMAQDQIARLLARVAKIGLVARVSANRYMTQAALQTLAGIAEREARALPGGRFSVAAYRDWSGMGRNLSIELLEFFDKVKFTRRLGNEREILRPAAGVFGAEEAAAPSQEPVKAG